MAGLQLCEPTELYNILNQEAKHSRLAESNYLYLLDVRSQPEYDESHIITAQRMKQEDGEYVVPEYMDLECVKYCVVYDGKTNSLDMKLEIELNEEAEEGMERQLSSTADRAPVLKPGGPKPTSLSRDQATTQLWDTGHASQSHHLEKNKLVFGAAIEGAKVLAERTRNPVLILDGGYERFSSCYHFFRTKKIFSMPQELDAFQPYPIEIIPSEVYLGTFKQACDHQMHKHLKIKAHVNVCLEKTPFFEGDKRNCYHILVKDSPEEDLYRYFRHAIHFMDAHVSLGSVILVFSTLGISRSCTIILAYLMHRNRETLKRSWTHMQKCKNNVRPNKSFMKQLVEWEKVIHGVAVTDISDPHY